MWLFETLASTSKIQRPRCVWGRHFSICVMIGGIHVIDSFFFFPNIKTWTYFAHVFLFNFHQDLIRNVPIMEVSFTAVDPSTKGMFSFITSDSRLGLMYCHAFQVKGTVSDVQRVVSEFSVALKNISWEKESEREEPILYINTYVSQSEAETIIKTISTGFELARVEAEKSTSAGIRQITGKRAYKTVSFLFFFLFLFFLTVLDLCCIFSSASWWWRWIGRKRWAFISSFFSPVLFPPS